MPPAPRTKGWEGYSRDGEGGSTHAPEAVPSEGRPGGASEETMEGVLKGLLGGYKGASSGRGSGWSKGGETEGPSRSPQARGGVDP